MKILFKARPDLLRVRGGDTIQILNTKKELEKLGVEVDLDIDYKNKKFESYDIVHLFNIIDCEDLLGISMVCRKPMVLSTIYVNYSEYDKKYRKGIIGFMSKVLSYNAVEYFKTCIKVILRGEKVSTVKYFIKGHKRSVEYLIRKVDCLLPNSLSEYNRIARDFNISKDFFIVPNGINEKKFQGVDNKKEDMVLCVGRIEGRKNQLNVVRAMNGTNIKTIFVGPVSENQRWYYNACINEADDNIEFISELTQDELLEYYKKAKVHVLASWFETTGLVSLEAAVMGCNIVVGDKGDVRDYFENDAFYCEPDDILSIKNAIFDALNASYSLQIKTRILKNYTWRNAAIKTLEAYQKIIKKYHSSEIKTIN